ncbi:MAG: alpha,alpha-trehalase [Patescibacteria group bacterium]|nr:alpha,alpha-trehalase [Patescibacteria group bacterium]
MQIQSSNEFTTTKSDKSLKIKNYEEEYKDCLAYIDSYWKKIIHKPAKKKVNHNFLTIPNNFFTPNDGRFTYMFYWDSFFMFKGLIGTKREWIMKDMIENFSYIFNKYGVIPNFSSYASVGRSQPPFLSSMILDTYKTFNNGNGALSKTSFVKSLLLNPLESFGNVKWLREKIEIAKKEYTHVWNNEELFNHFVKKFGLNRYGDRDVGYAHSSELESGWDFTSRFYNRCNEFLPIDLNSYLYKYEKDFELIASLLGDKEEMEFWQNQANKRKNMINKLMWNDKEGFYFDYDYVHKEQGDFFSLAGFVPLWAGIATHEHAKKMVKRLDLFESKYGLIITAQESLAPKIDFSSFPPMYRPVLEETLKQKQWDWPYIWPPLEYLTVIGLLKYGFVKDAKRIMDKSLNAQARIFRKYGTFFERIDGIKGDKPVKNAHYKTQSGFGWTNAVFYRYIRILKALEKKQDIYGFPKAETPPYDLAILH